MRKSFLLTVACIFLVSTTIHAQFVVAPNVYTNTTAGTGGTGLNTFIRDTGNPRSGQLLLNANQLGSILPGNQITGIAFRLYTGNTLGYPALTASWANYTINVGVGVAFGAQTTTFANNFIGTPTQVRTGGLVVNAGSYATFGTASVANPFGPTISFTNPYTYTGGNLLIEIRHSGSNITNTATDFLEAVPVADPQYNTNVWSATATGEAALTGAQATFTIARLTFTTAVPEPTTLALAGLTLTGVGFYGWRRWTVNNQRNLLSVKSRFLRSR